MAVMMKSIKLGATFLLSCKVCVGGGGGETLMGAVVVITVSLIACKILTASEFSVVNCILKASI